MDLIVSTEINISPIIMVDGVLGKNVDKALEGGMPKIEKAYVDQAPGNIGDFKGGIRYRKLGILNYIVESTAKNKGRPYPLFLFQGTGKLKNMPDFGFTTGHVRAGDVAYGIGGIRPNKAAARARSKVMSEFMEFVITKISSPLQNFVRKYE